MLNKRSTLPDEMRGLLSEGKYDEAKELMRGCDMNAPTKDYPNGGIFSLRGIDEKFGRYLIENGADINKTDCRGYTPLMHMASEYDCPETLRLYARLGAKLNYLDPTAGTALHAAARANRTDNIEALLSLGADTSTTDIDGRSCLDSVMSSAEGVFAADSFLTAKLLAEKGLAITEYARGQLRRIYREIENYGVNFSEAENAKFDIIMPEWCALFGVELAFPIVRIKPEPVRYTKPYAIFNAVRYGDLETVKKLVGADLSLANAVAPKKPTDTKGMSILQVALTTGWHRDIARYLLDMGADVNYKGFLDGNKPARPVPLLHDAVKVAVSNCRRYCLDDDDTSYSWQHTERDADEAFDFLRAVLEKGADADIRDEYNDNAITVAVSQAMFTCFPMRDDQTGKFYPGVKLTAESTRDMKRIFRLLIEAGADTDPRNSYSKKTLSEFYSEKSVWSAYKEALKETGKE